MTKKQERGGGREKEKKNKKKRKEYVWRIFIKIIAKKKIQKKFSKHLNLMSW